MKYFNYFRSYGIGAILFVISDSVLAISKFVAPDGQTNQWYYLAIMSTYYSALLFFAFSALEKHSNVTSIGNYLKEGGTATNNQ